jgi:hypothetical protein
MEDLQSWYLKEQSSRPFEMESVMITLSLSSEVNVKYQETLNVWLQSWVKANFQLKGEALVIQRPADMFSNTETTGVINKTKLSWEHIERYQNILGMMFLGLLFIVAQLSKKLFSERKLADVNAKNSESKQIVSMVNSVSGLPQVYNLNADSLEIKESIRLLKVKIAWMSPNLKKQINPLIMYWSEKNFESYIKIGAFIEALAEGGAVLPESSRLSMPKLPSDAHLYLPTALLQLQKLSSFELLAIYQEIYTDLLAKDLSDYENEHMGFEFLSHLSTVELQTVFDFLSEPYQVALLTRLPKTVRMLYTQTADLNKLRHILNKSLTAEDVTDQQLLFELQAWQNKKTGHAITGSDFVFKISKLRETWSAISRLEETLWMREVTSAHPAMKESLMKQEHHLCFMNDWPTEYLRKFCLQTKTVDLAAAITCLPFLSEKILNACGELTRKNILSEMSSVSESKLTARFDDFINSFDAFIENENFSLVSQLRIVKNDAA